ncbi:MAG: spore germination protein [Firmicutes bacterium]|nr:spore germination protein [Bacillota bacterium]
MRLTRDLAENLDALKERLGVGTTFDVLVREIEVGGRDAALVFVDGLVNDESTIEVMRFLLELKREDIVPQPVEKLVRRGIPYIEVTKASTVDEVIDQVLAGPMALLLHGQDQAVILDMRQYPVRSLAEPDLEKVTRGSREGLVETVVFNTALIRRRLRDPRLRFEMFSVGRITRSDVVLGYLEGVANPELVAEIRRKLDSTDIGALTMGSQSLLELLVGQRLNPLPLARLTERPDVVSAHLMEGHVVVLTDTSPTALVLPANVWHFTQHAEEYFQNPVVGSYLRLVRFAAIGISLLLGPLWLLLATMDGKPPWLAFIGPRDEPAVPLWAQFFMLEFGLDLIRMALIHTPAALSTALGIVGAILLGELATTVGLFVPETVLYSAIGAIGYFATPSLEFAFAVRLFRYFLFALVAVWGTAGLLGGLAITALWFGFTRSFHVPYLYPLVPFDGKALARLLLRFPILHVGVRTAPKQHRRGPYPNQR